jgi:hypothetical protein
VRIEGSLRGLRGDQTLGETLALLAEQNVGAERLSLGNDGVVFFGEAVR